MKVISFNETKLLEDMIDSALGKSFHVLVETMENMSKYGGKQAEDLYGMRVILKLEGQDYRLTTQPDQKRRVPVLKEKIDTINRYNRDDLKDFYRKSLSEQTVESERTEIWV